MFLKHLYSCRIVHFFQNLRAKGSLIFSIKKGCEIDCSSMSLRYMSRVFYQTGVKMLKDTGSKCGDSTMKSLKDSAAASSASSSSSSKQTWRFLSFFDSPAFKAPNTDKAKQAEESLRLIMFLSCWGPN